jgi:DNA-nicking Smr family endonuclease
VKRPHGKSGSKGRPSGDDHDEDVWLQTAATVEPLKRGKPRIHPASEAAKEVAKAKPPAMPEAKPARMAPPVKPHSSLASPRGLDLKPSTRAAPELAAFDRNSVRKIRSGRMEIEARVDLHGMRQDEAHAALRRFLLTSQRRGLRFVLVITGKGRTAAPAEGSYAEPERERGILKRNVPRWLEEPDIRSIVVSYTSAAIQHGGEGAIYVHLRTKDRS